MVRRFGSSLVPFITLALSACVAVDHGNKGESDEGAGGSGSGAEGGASSSGGKKGQGGTAGGDTGPAPTNSTPALQSIDAHVTGRYGDDITLHASGADAEGDVVFLSTHFLNAGGEDVSVFDTRWDGVPDSAENRLLFDSSLAGQKRFDGTVTLTGFGSLYPDAAKLVVHLEDVAGNVSEDQTIDIGQQVEKKLGQACDPDILENRCARGLSCGGDKPTCQSGKAPDLINVLYARSADGPRLLAAGGDPDDDLATLRLEFFDSANAPVKIDLNGDQIPDSASWDLDAYGTSDHGSFFIADQLGLGFEVISPKMNVTPIDGQGSVGTTKTIKISGPFEQVQNHACDPRGFDACAAGDICAPGILGAQNVCVAATSVRKTTCSEAPVLDPTKTTKVYGRAQGVSQWDPPLGCTQVGWTHRPEGIAKVHLSEAAKHLVVTTALPETRIDTVLYMIANTVPNCGNPVNPTTICNDDVHGYSSTISATNVPAGDYIVIVDSAGEAGGSYGLSVTVD
jgi:hypothetical protein